jgi:hypothetical protein
MTQSPCSAFAPPPIPERIYRRVVQFMMSIDYSSFRLEARFQLVRMDKCRKVNTWFDY